MFQFHQKTYKHQLLIVIVIGVNFNKMRKQKTRFSLIKLKIYFFKLLQFLATILIFQKFYVLSHNNEQHAAFQKTTKLPQCIRAHPRVTNQTFLWTVSHQAIPEKFHLFGTIPVPVKMVWNFISKESKEEFLDADEVFSEVEEASNMETKVSDLCSMYGKIPFPQIFIQSYKEHLIG